MANMTLKEFCCAALFSVVLYGAAAGQPPLVFFNSPCECVGSHGEYRWLVKTDAETPPGSISPDHKIKPSDVGAWLGPGGKFHEDTPRSDKENQWFEVTGRVTLVRAEADGDLHIQLMDADGANPVNVVVEVPC